MRVFVSAMANFGFRSWVDAHGTMPDNVLPRASTFAFSQLGQYDPGPPSKPGKSIAGKDVEDGAEAHTLPRPESVDEDEEATNPQDPFGRASTSVEWELRSRRVVGALIALTALWMFCTWALFHSLFPGLSAKGRLISLVILSLYIFQKITDKNKRREIREGFCAAVKGWVRRLNEWMLGVPARPERTPEDEPADRFGGPESEMPNLVLSGELPRA